MRQLGLPQTSRKLLHPRRPLAAATMAGPSLIHMTVILLRQRLRYANTSKTNSLPISLMLSSVTRHPSPMILVRGGWSSYPKKALVDQPDQFRPIVCGEVLLQILAELAMARIVSKWPVVECCFGACRGRGVPEALYIL